MKCERMRANTVRQESRSRYHTLTRTHYDTDFTCEVGKGILICVLAPSPWMLWSMRKTFGEASCA